MSTFNWRDLKPDDGYFAALNISGEVSAELVFGLYVNGSLLKQKILDSRQWPSARQIGALKRDLIFWEGLAEYMNAGGRMVDISDDLQRLESDSSSSDRLVFEGWSYFDTGVSENGNRVHEFICDDVEAVTPMRFVRWVRGEFIDYQLTEEDMLEAENYGRITPGTPLNLREIDSKEEG